MNTAHSSNLSWWPLPALALLAAVGSGCVPPRITVHDAAATPGIDWVLTTGQELVLEWWLLPAVYTEYVSAVQLSGDQLVVTCNLSSPAEVLMPMKVYVVDSVRARLLRTLQGPAGAYEPPVWEQERAKTTIPPLTSRGLWFKDSRGWSVMDLESGRVTSDVMAPSDIEGNRPDSCQLVDSSEDPRAHEFYEVYELQGGAMVTIDGESKPGGQIHFAMRARPEAPPISLTLPFRYVGGMERCVAVQHGSRIFVGYGAYLIAFRKDEVSPTPETAP